MVFCYSLQKELKNLKTQYSAHMERTQEVRRNLSKQIKSSVQKYEGIQKKIKWVTVMQFRLTHCMIVCSLYHDHILLSPWNRHFAAADATKFKEMWITLEAEVKQLVERSLLIDSLICKQHLGLAWERPEMTFMDLSGPIHPQKMVHQAIAQVDTSDGLKLEAEAESMDMDGEGTEGQSESDAKVELDTAKKVLELLCDEAVRHKCKSHVYTNHNCNNMPELYSRNTSIKRESQPFFFVRASCWKIHSCSCWLPWRRKNRLLSRLALSSVWVCDLPRTNTPLSATAAQCILNNQPPYFVFSSRPLESKVRMCPSWFNSS